MGTTAPCPTPQRWQGSGRAAFPVGAPLAATQSLPPLQGRATEWRPKPSFHGDLRSPLRNLRPRAPHLSRWHQGIRSRAHHPAHRPPRQADQEAPLYAHGPRPGPGPQAAGPPWHHGVGALRPGPRPAGVAWPAYQQALQAACMSPMENRGAAGANSQGKKS